MPNATGQLVEGTTPLEGLALLRLNRPEAQNALNEALLRQLREEFDRVALDPSVQTIAFSGSGEVFMAGADLPFFVRSLLSNKIERIMEFTRSAHELLASIERCPKRTVAIVDGVAFGGGLELVLACHCICALPTAKFALPETGLGIYPGMGGMQRASRRIGVGLTKWLVYTGSIVPANQALRMGLIDALATPEDALNAAQSSQRIPGPVLDDRLRETEAFFGSQRVSDLLDPAIGLPREPHLTRAVVQTRGKAPLALALAEQLIDAGRDLPVADAIAEELRRLPEILASEDARAGLLTLGKSKSVFVGR